MLQSQYKHAKETLIELSKSQKIDRYRSEKIIEKITQEILLKIEKIMRQFQQLNVAEFLRLFLFVMQDDIQPEDKFYAMYGLFKVFKEICRSYKTTKISFSQLSSFITEKMPATDQEVIVKEKLLPVGFQIPQEQKSKMILPSISGKVLTERKLLNPIPALFDKYQHTNRCISQALYSSSSQQYYAMDLPSNFIRVSDRNLNQIVKINSELQISKKQAAISYIAWSQAQGRIGAILGNYSLSFWSKEDNYRFQVNIPLPSQHLSNPYEVLGYMQSMKQWYVIDNRPVVSGLSSKNFQPAYQIKNFKMLKQKPTQKIYTLEMKYQKVLCVGFERKVFLLSLSKREVITEITNFKTSITSMVFSQTFQTLFVSNFQNYFKAYELTEHCDLTDKGMLEGHKHQIILLGVVQKKPIVYSLEEMGLMKLWDIRDFSCYQTFSVLKNVRYLQMFSVNQGVCLVGSKLYLYKWSVEKSQHHTNSLHIKESPKDTVPTQQRVILITSVNKNILIISTLTLRLYSYRKGNLINVIRGLFKEKEISFAFLNTAKRQLYIANQEGRFLILETESFTVFYQFKFLPHPKAMHYSQRQDLITIAAQREIHIMEWRRLDSFELKRRIFNQNQNILTCKVYSTHDLIAAVYQQQGDQLTPSTKQKINHHQNAIFFYTFQRGKAISYLTVDRLVGFEIHKQKNILVLLQQEKVKIYSFKKSLSSLTFTLHHQIQLWPMSLLTREFKQHLDNVEEIVFSQSLLLYQNYIVVASSFSNLFCSLQVNFQNIFPGVVEQDSNNYNPYRISVESHVEAFSEMKKQAQIVDMTEEAQKVVLKLKETKAYAKSLYCFKLGNLLGVYNDKLDLHFFDHSSHKLMGVINYQLTLPKMWDMTFYDQAELEDLDFVLDYMENQEKKTQQYLDQGKIINENIDNSIFSLTLNVFKSLIPQKKKPSPLTIQKILQSCGKLSPQKSLLNPMSNNHSLRERKLMLQKQRQQKQRLQNYLEHQEEQQLNKVRTYNSHDAQSNINEVLNFFALNRNQIVKNKGIEQTEMPQQVKLLERKLQGSLKLIQRKQSLSDISLVKNSPMIARFSQTKLENKLHRLKSLQRRQSVSLNQNELIFKKIGSLKLIESSLGNTANDSPYKKVSMSNMSESKTLLKILDSQVKRSKMSTRFQSSKERNSSLPAIKRYN